MKSIFKNYYLLAVSLMFFIFQSCEEKNFDDQTKSKTSEIKIEEKSIDDLLFLNKFKTAYNKVNVITSSKSRGSFEEDFNFTIADNPVKVINYEGKTTYTMLIKRDFVDFTALENLVIEIDENNLMRAIIVKYNLSDEILPSPDNSFYIPTSSKEITTIANEHTNQIASRVTCTITLMCRYLDGPIGSTYSTPHVACSACIDKNDYFLDIDCIESGGSDSQNNGDLAIPDSNDNVGNHNGGGSNTSGSSNNNYPPSPIITSPVVIPITAAEVALRKTFTNNLNPQQLLFFSLLTNIEKLNFFGFLFVDSITPENTDEDGLWNVTSYSSSAIIFAKDVINRMMANPEVFKSIKPFIIERNIGVDFALSPCAKNIISKIKNTSQADFAFIIAKLGDSNSAYTVNINSVPPDQNHLAQTYFVNSNLDNINLDLTTNHLTTGTQLAIATTILHEFIHAYFLSLAADNFMNSTNIPNNLNYLWNQYVYKLSGTIDGNLAQHNQIASTYINAIGLALSEFDSNLQPIQFYKDLAWAGLIGTIPYNSLSQVEKDRIKANIAAEENNISIDLNGTVAIPRGIPCN